jgi:hypothetical protein
LPKQSICRCVAWDAACFDKHAVRFGIHIACLDIHPVTIDIHAACLDIQNGSMSKQTF